MPIPTLTIPTPDHAGVKTSARVLTIGKRRFFYSENVCIGYEYGPIKVRLSTKGSENQRRHQHELGIQDWTLITQPELDELVERYYTGLKTTTKEIK
jgi:hypothetical protein